MAEVILNPAIDGLGGKMGDVVYRYNKRTGKTSISKIPDMTRVKWSKAQKAQRRRFKPAVWAVYQKIARKKHKRAWDVAMKDYFQGNKLIANL